MEPIQPPASLQDSASDFVTCTARGNQTEDRSDNAACYIKYMDCLETHGLFCETNLSRGHNLCDPDLYTQWMHLCQSHNLVPPEARIFVDDKKNCMSIPGGIYDRHLMYTGICCYRWSTHLIRMIWQVVRHCETGLVTFEQALHYGLSQHIANANHSFSYIAPYGSYRGINGPNSDLAGSLIWKTFYALPVEKRKKITGYTNEHLNKLSKALGAFPVEEVKDVLQERWTPLYQAQDRSAESLQKQFNAIKKAA